MAELQNLTVSWAEGADIAFIDSLLNDPAIQARQHVNAKCSWQPLFAQPEKFMAVIIRRAGAPVGAFLLVKKTVAWEVHAALTIHGRAAIRAARAGFALFMSRTGHCRVTAYCPRDIPEVLHFALASGARIVGSDAKNIYVELCQRQQFQE